MLLAKLEGRGVHHLEAAVDGLLIADVLDQLRVRVLAGVAVVHAVHGGSLEHRVRADLGCAQAGGGVGGEEGVAAAAGQQHDLAVLQALHGAIRAVVLCKAGHLLGGEHGGPAALAQNGVLHGQRIDDGGQHAHLIGLHRVHRVGEAAAPDVAAAHDNAHLHAQIVQPDDGCRGTIHALRVEGQGCALVGGNLLRGEGLAAELQYDALIHEFLLPFL